MVLTNYGMQMMAYRLGSDISTINSVKLGSGIGTASKDNALMFAEWDAQPLSQITYSGTNKLNFTSDWAPHELSGLQMREVGLCVSGIGSLWFHHTFHNTIFNGTQELKIEQELKLF